jgi:HK97 family phage major capsid protein
MANVNGTEIDLTPTSGMREEAERYRAWKDEGQAGGTDVASTRATQILSGNELSPDTVITMSAWFARHEVDKQAEGFSPGEAGYPSPGRVAWAAWGGDPGKRWSDSLSDRIKQAEDRTAPTPPSSLRAAPGALSEGDFVAWNSSGGTARGRIEHIMREGVLGIPDSDFSITATPDDPAALIRIYRPSGDGWNETETLVGHKFSTLRKINPLSSADDEDDDKRGAEPRNLEQRPYPNEHAARLLDPDQFERFRRSANEFGQGIDAIYGISGNEPVQLQALRFDAARFTVSEAKDWLGEHDYKPILFEPATGKSMETATAIDVKALSKEVHRREAPQGLRIEDTDATGLTFSFSSEAPVERWWGREVLLHDAESMDLARMNDGGPWLWNHNRDVVLGVAEKAWLGDDRRLYVKTKWSPNTTEKGTEEYKRRRDIETGIVRNVSFAYEINDVREATNGDMQVTRWNVLEVSSVSVPADQSVGLGRALSSTEPTEPTSVPVQETHQPESSTLQTKQTAERGTDTPQAIPSMEQSINVQEVQTAARQSERERVAAIRAMCDQHQVGADLATHLIDTDASLDQAREAVLKQLGRTRTEFQGRVHDDGAASIGLTPQEVKRYSLMNVIRHLADPSDRSAREAASFELECSKAAETKLGRAARGVVMPWDVMAAPQLRAPQSVGTASAGGYVVDTQLLTGSFIDLVRNRSALLGLNVTTLTGLVGNVDIPKKTGNTTAYWVGEDVAVSETNLTLGQVSMTPKSLGGYVDITRRLMIQQSMDVEAMVRADLAESIALAIDSSAVYGLGGASALLGLKNITGVGTETLTSDANTNKSIGGVTYYFGNFADYVNMETTVSVSNLDVASMFYVGNAHVRGALKQTLRNTNSEMMIWENNEVNGYAARVSNQLVGSNVLFGDFSQAIFGFWSGVDVTVDPYTNSTKGTTRIVAFQDVDFGVRNPAAFVFGSGNA